MNRKVCGEFPKFCYKGFCCEKHAKDFIDKGTFRMGCLLSYREGEGKRCDPTEGRGCIKEPGIVTSVLFSPNPAEQPIVTREMGHVEHHPESGNTMFCFCMSLPDVNLDHVKKAFGKYIVKINNPRKLAEDIYDYYIKSGIRVLVEGCAVVYNKGQKLDRKLEDFERLDLSYKQKPEKPFGSDREFRIVAIKFGEPCPQECKFLNGTFEQVGPERMCKFYPFEVRLGKPVDYLELVNVE